jgi:glycosyltransferase involved in cell wall biosynthesis
VGQRVATAGSVDAGSETRLPGSVAVVHDLLNQVGGAERVALEMVDRVWPGADLYTSLYRPQSTYPEFGAREIRTSFLDRFPVDEGFRTLLPLYPAAFRSLGVLEHEVVVSSSYGWSHAVRTAPETTHVVYCYTPARWLYAGGVCLPSPIRRLLLRPVIAALRRWDARAARRPDAYVAISEHVRRRIKRAYGRDAEVVYPPVDTERFRPRPRGERLLVVSRLMSYKRIDLVVRAASRLGLGLDVVGTGPELSSLRVGAGPTVTFHGSLPDDAVTEMFESCSAFCASGEEDFAIAPVEANAAGKPVVAFASGGTLETQIDGTTAAFFEEPTVECLTEALRRVDRIETSPEDIARVARRFSREAFRDGLRQAVSRVASRRAGDTQTDRTQGLVAATPA